MVEQKMNSYVNEFSDRENGVPYKFGKNPHLFLFRISDLLIFLLLRIADSNAI
jgi:hypothetical protein